MSPSRERLDAEAAATGFDAATLEKIAFLLAVLEGVNRHPLLKGRLALKGGTALNLFAADVPRLSIDVDLNYVGDPDLADMQARRPDVERAIQAVCEREGLQLRKVPGEHAGGSWILTYHSAYGGTQNLKFDVVFMYRVPLWPVQIRDSRPVGGIQATDIAVMDDHELAAGKLVALLARSAARDLFDTHLLLRSGSLDYERLRVAFVVYGGMSRKDWRRVDSSSLRGDALDLERNLLPLLRTVERSALTDFDAWAETLVTEARKAIAPVLPLRPAEVSFLNHLLDEGEIRPELLTGDATLAGNIRTHPGLAWKALNVKQHLISGRSTGDSG
ncbi:MAG TPA: nucleotidyl transferase AbiEii/AbiGii toxin family protein [Armatimonadota bacterium]|nr:nucleotidyl transferase AbiEii/AbiGii toxin family protein [Armatimonadota bacterium]